MIDVRDAYIVVRAYSHSAACPTLSAACEAWWYGADDVVRLRWRFVWTDHLFAMYRNEMLFSASRAQSPLTTT